MPQNNNEPVRLPAAAKHMAHDFDDKFVFSDTNAHIPPQQVKPLEHVPEQAEEHVPDAVPPEGLPSEAAGHTDNIATDHAPDWLLS